jgi:hypothetical protein
MARRAGALASVVVALVAATSAIAVVVQQNGLRVGVLSQVIPYKLPREGTAPIAIFLSGHVAAADGSVLPQLRRMSIRVNRHGLLQSKGLSVCPQERIRATSTSDALSRCGDALVGSGRFWATIVLPDQGPYATRGRLLVFNGREGGRPAIFAHIYTTKPFATSFVIPFTISRIAKGAYGTELNAAFPQALGDWGFVDRIKLTLKRKYSYGGRRLSYFNAGCPAPAGADRTAFPLAFARFYFAGGKQLGLRIDKACGVAG